MATTTIQEILVTLNDLVIAVQDNTGFSMVTKEQNERTLASALHDAENLLHLVKSYPEELEYAAQHCLAVDLRDSCGDYDIGVEFMHTHVDEIKKILKTLCD